MNVNVGDRKLQKCGLEAEVVELIGSNRCKVKFNEDSFVEVSIETFHRGRIKTIKDNFIKIGDKVLQRNGHTFEVIAIKPNRKLDVISDEGVIRRDVSSCQFKAGKLASKNKTSVGDRVLQKSGSYAEVIELLPNVKCTVKFDSGTIKENVLRQDFRDGKILEYCTADKYVGTRVVAKNGIGLEIIEYNSYKDITVKSDDGKISKSTLSLFKNGSSMLTNSPDIIKKEQILGMVVKQKDGYDVKCVDYKNKSSIVVEYPWGYRKTVCKQTFLKGNSYLYKYETYLGKTCKNIFNMSFTVNGYENDLFYVSFENGQSVKCGVKKVYDGTVYLDSMVALTGGYVALKTDKSSIIKSVYYDLVIGKYIALIEKNNYRTMIKL